MLTRTELLKLQLMTEGMVVSEQARSALAGEDGLRPLTLADYASTSGVALELDGGIWVNAPIVEFNPNFVAAPPHRLDFLGDHYVVRSGDFESLARPLPVPSYHDQVDEEGVAYTNYAITHTDRVRISPVQGCTFACKFCDLPYKRRYELEPLRGLIGAAKRALADPVLPASHLLISGGVPRDDDWESLYAVYEASAAELGVPVDVMMVPVPGKLDARRLHDLGIHGLAINLEMYDQTLALKTMAKKARLTRDNYLDFIEGAVAIFGPGRVRSLLIVGMEPLDATLAGVNALAERGCEPVLSPFRPDPATPMRNVAPPSVETLRIAYEESVQLTARHGVKLGPRCIPCMHNTLTFPEGSDYYHETAHLLATQTLR